MNIVELKMDEYAGEFPYEAGSYCHVQPTEHKQESIITELKTIMEDTDDKSVISASEATYGLQLVHQLNQQGGEQELSQSIVTELKTIMDGAEGESSISVSQATYGLQLVEKLHQYRVDQVEHSGSIAAELKTIMDGAEAENSISVSEASHGLQLVEELNKQRGEEATFANAKTSLDPDEGEKATLIHLMSEPLQLVEELHRQDNESEISVSYSGHSNKTVEICPETISERDVVENRTLISKVELGHHCDNGTELSSKIIQLTVETISEHDQAKDTTFGSQETCLGKDVETKVSIPSAQNSILTVEEPLQESVPANMKPMLKNGEIQNGPCLDKDSTQHENGTEPGIYGKSSTPAAETEPGVGTVSSIEVVMIEDEKEVDELESLNAVMNQKLNRIDEIAKQVTAIDIEMAQMVSECGETKRRHTKFIDLLKLITESQLPLNSHREVQQLIRRKDKAAQKWLSNALDLQVCIDTKAKLKLSLQDESRKLAKLVEAHKQIHQTLTDRDQVIKLEEEAVNSETGPGCDRIKATYTRKRKSHHDGQSSEMQAKRMVLDTVGDSVQE